MILQGTLTVETLFLRVTYLLGSHVNHQSEIRKSIISKEEFYNQERDI
jgi:hypothetical protein